MIKDLNYYKENCAEDYLMTPISVTRYITELEKKAEETINPTRSSLQLPSELEPVLAKIEHINSLGKSNWYEVVYNDGNWRSYQGSKTFKDGEKVVKWDYCKAIV